MSRSSSFYVDSPIERCRTTVKSPSVVREGLVGFRHLVCVVALLHCVAAILCRVDEFRRQPLPHRLFPSVPRILYQPAHRQRDPALGPNLDRHLIGGATDATALDLELGLHVVESLAKNVEGLFLVASLNDVEGAI